MKTIKSILLTIIIISFYSCTQESTEHLSLENEADTIIRQLSDSVTLGGVVFPSKEEYNSYPKLKVEDMPILIPQNLENRTGYKMMKTPKVANQGKEGSCLPFAMGYVGVSYLLHTTKGMSYAEIDRLPDTLSKTIEQRAIKTKYAIRSPEYIYNAAKISADCNSGCYPYTVLQYLKNQGVCSWAEMPYSDENGCKTLPTALQKEQAKIGKIKTWGTVPKKAEEIKKFIKAGYPVIFAQRLDDHFYTQTNKQPFIYHTPGGNLRNGHAYAVVGYDDSRDVFIAQNSWGLTRHDKGYFYIKYNIIAMPSIDVQLYVIKSM